jgi:hypothetical protein
MLATTPPPVKPQSRVYAALPAAGFWARTAAGRLREMRSMSGVISLGALKSECGGEIGARPLQCRMTVGLFPRAQPTVVIY